MKVAISEFVSLPDGSLMSVNANSDTKRLTLGANDGGYLSGAIANVSVEPDGSAVIVGGLATFMLYGKLGPLFYEQVPTYMAVVKPDGSILFDVQASTREWSSGGAFYPRAGTSGQVVIEP